MQDEIPDEVTSPPVETAPEPVEKPVKQNPGQFKKKKVVEVAVTDEVKVVEVVVTAKPEPVGPKTVVVSSRHAQSLNITLADGKLLTLQPRGSVEIKKELVGPHIASLLRGGYLSLK